LAWNLQYAQFSGKKKPFFFQRGTGGLGSAISRDGDQPVTWANPWQIAPDDVTHDPPQAIAGHGVAQLASGDKAHAGLRGIRLLPSLSGGGLNLENAKNQVTPGTAAAVFPNFPEFRGAAESPVFAESQSHSTGLRSREPKGHSRKGVSLSPPCRQVNQACKTRSATAACTLVAGVTLLSAFRSQALATFATTITENAAAGFAGHAGTKSVLAFATAD
jgi:hypothetical protein